MVLGAIGHEGNEHWGKKDGREKERERNRERKEEKKIKKEGKRDGGRILPNRIHQNRKVLKNLSLPDK